MVSSFSLVSFLLALRCFPIGKRGRLEELNAEKEGSAVDVLLANVISTLMDQ